MIIVGIIYFTDKTPDKISSKLFVPFLNTALFNMFLAFIPFGVVLLIGSSNAVNLTDGLDGLAIGCTLFVIAAFTILTYLCGHIKIASYLKIPFIKESAELTVFCASLVGACLGFLWYNAHPAQVFMGDTGSLSLGGAIGTIALMIKKELLLLIVGGIFVAEAFSVILQVLYFKWKKKRIFLMAPLHHHFEMKGWAESKVIIRFWIIGIILAMVGLATLKIR
jgi:phospho-N-acetylmuramoyl-pentapeptide-transferase